MAQSMQQIRHASSQPTSTKPVFRADIQGLRALAVLAVIADHLFGYPAGGFVGVDVFFVISGFIITSLLLRQRQKTGGISFTDFYRRRVKRILPASTLVLAVTVIGSFLIFRAGRATSIMTDGAWSLFFAGNWRFAITGTDYWAGDGTVSPLQHYWSLGVEEQFYFVWPVLILLAFKLGRGRGRRVLLAVLAAVTVVSFAWAVHETSTNASWAYFSTASRAWELGVGAILAICVGLLARIPNAVRPVLAWIGLVGIVASLFVIDSHSSIPAPGVVLPVLSAALIIAAGAGGEQRFIAPLTNRVSGYIGDISYSLYLWHFPAIILLPAVLPFDGAPAHVAVLAVTAALSAFSYHFVEDPIRKSTWLEPHRKRSRGGYKVSERLKVAGIIALAILTIGVSGYAMVKNNGSSVAAAKPAPTPTAAPTGGTAPGPLSAVEASLAAAMKTAQWPELSPSLDTVETEGVPDENGAGCGKTDFNNPSSCNFPSPGATKNAVVYGDSTGITLLPTVREALKGEYNVRGMTRANCVLVDIATTLSQNDANACAEHRDNAVSAINASKPALVFVIQNYGWINSWVTDVPQGQRGNVWQQKTSDLIMSLAPSGARIVMVDPAPEGDPLSKCATRTSTPANCVTTPSKGYLDAVAATIEAAKVAGVKHIDSMHWFCTRDGSCPAFTGTTPIKRDNVHTTKQYALQLAPVFKNQLTALG